MTQALSQQINMQAVALGRLLSMTGPEFEEAVRHEIDENPALEAVDADSYADDDDFDESATDLQRGDYSDEDEMPVNIAAQAQASRAVEAASYTADDARSAADILLDRLSTEYRLTPTGLIIANYLVNSLDDNGYLTRPLADIADDISIAEGFEPRRAEIEELFADLRNLDPAGIGARDLRDCMLLQLERLSPTSAVENASAIVRDHFDLLSKRHFDRLQARLDISRDDLQDALDVIRSLNPKPAAALEGTVIADRIQQVVPDYVLEYDAGTDRFTLGLTGNVPELRIEESFRADIATPTSRRADSISSTSRRADSGSSTSLRAASPVDHNPTAPQTTSRHAAEANTFIRTKRNSAAQFIRLAELRAATLMAIGRAIVARQHDFFVTGDRADIKPMILRDIEQDTGLHQSVISRGTSGKYILAPHGIYPLKLFFNERHDPDSDLSTHRILSVLRDAIENEDKHAPLPDRVLAEILLAQGFDVARRTVAKYRERLGYPVARLRRQL